jgi:hypothetical protein
LGLFQAVIGNNHRVEYDVATCVEDLALLGGDEEEGGGGGVGAKKLYWLVPSMHYYSFVMRSELPQHVEQYAVLIEFPEGQS